MRILIVEDEVKVAEAIFMALQAADYSPIIAGSAEEASALLEQGDFDLILLDLGLPGKDGVRLLSELRAERRTIPVIIVSARDTTESRILGLDAGADDYLIKPFELAELLARIRAIARRQHQSEIVHMRLADLELDLISRKAKRAGREFELTTREFQILECLFRNVGEPVSRAQLARSVWGDMPRATPLDNVIDVHMARLRRKIDTKDEAPLIFTIRGVGFVLKEGL
jgi:DNA-binding response OmpR family regulator